ncbi:NYN domain-containing protein [Actinocorallia sp. A-T 12471]|uniref:NYN domain-containing protein n=1 Tax=Actinocorallia sp. A-T 12471 TaxID=3089813 RepID=UPI0029D0FD42|nr:NYN domain-containing protein [Actinocorallia sp. A-T 12471]MDX6741959.1 NYN domain-containing protein [Actinocorallia sp. A-T 12471]
MERCALFVDAGYLLADGAMAVHGIRQREQVSWDFAGLLQLLGNLARERAGMPLLRCYWYETSVEGRRTPEQEALADLPGLKLRLGRSRPGRRESVDAELHRDLMTLARNRAIADAVVVSGDEDLAAVLQDAQDLGIRVTVVHVAVDGNWTISRVLRQECDDLIEIGAGHLRPYVALSTERPAESSASLSAALSASTSGSVSSSSMSGSSMPASLASVLAAASSNGSTLSSLANGLGASAAPAVSAAPPAAAPVAAPVAAPPAAPAAPQLPSPSSAASNVLSGIPFTTPSQTPAPAAPAQPSYLNTGPVTPNPFAVPAPAQPATASQFGTAASQFGSTSSASPFGTAPSAYPLTPPAAAAPAMPSYTASPALPVVPQAPAVPAAGPSLSDAVKAAHTEGQEFGESVARDAPALWLEAVLARKPRMPSDLEARLLQGSALPIDFLLHDEVRHSLRRGFWDALERSRR